MTTLKRGCTAAVAMAVCALFAGCASAPTAAPSPTASPSPTAPTPSPSASPTPSASPSGSPSIVGVVTFGTLDQKHVDTPVTYPQSPPVGGPHSARWEACDGVVYRKDLSKERAVHSLEHGAVWITYRPGLPADQVATLAAQVGDVDYRMMSPYAGLTSPIVLTAWSTQLAVDDAADPRVAAFLALYTNGPQTPEPGAPCAIPQAPVTNA